MITASPTLRIAAVAGLIGLVLGIALGLGIGWKLYHHEQVVEAYKPAIILKHDTIALERTPNQPPPKEVQQAAKQLHGKLTRTATITLKPKPKADAPAGCSCEDIKVDVGVVDEGNGNRVVAHAEGAEITGGTDNPLIPYTMAKETKWEVGLVVPVENYQGTGGYVSRKIGPFSVGLQVAKPYATESYTAMATIGIRF